MVDETSTTFANLAPQPGLEPGTYRLTAGCSAIELLRNTHALLLTRGELYTAWGSVKRCDFAKVYALCLIVAKGWANSNFVLIHLRCIIEAIKLPCAYSLNISLLCEHLICGELPQIAFICPPASLWLLIHMMSVDSHSKSKRLSMT